MALVHVVADRRVDGAGTLADGNGDALAVGQGDYDGATSDGRVDRRGVDDAAAFGDRRRGGQGDGGCVGHVGNAGGYRALVRHQTLVITAAHASDLSRDGRMALVDVVANRRIHSPGALADRNSDALAVGQGDHDWATGDRRVDRCGVDDGAAFGDRRSGGQGDGGGVGDISNAGRHRVLVRYQVFVIAAADPGDVGRNGSVPLVDVIADRRVDGAGALADGDGDALTIGQGHHDRAAGDRRIDRGGVDDDAALGDRRCGGQGDGGCVGYVGNARRYGALVCHQTFVIAPAHPSDLSGDVRMALIDVVADRRIHSAGALANRDGDALAVGQRHHDRAAGDRRIDRCGVDDGAAFCDRRRGGQGHGSGVGDVGNARVHGGGIGDQTLEITAAHADDLGGDCGMALIDVAADRRVDGTRALTDGNGDALAVGQGDYDWAAGDGGVDRCGVDDGASLGDRRRGGQGDSGGVGDIGDAGGNRVLVRYQVFVITAAHASDLGRDGRMALVHIVADRGIDRARALADRDGDVLAVGQGDYDRVAGDWGVDRCGVDDSASLGDRRRGGQGDSGGVGDIGDAGGNRVLVRYQVFVVTTADTVNVRGDCRMALVDVIADRCVDGAGALADRDGNALAVGQGDHDGTASDWRIDRCGVDDGAAFGD
ncbi:hypothetical protein PSRE111525_27880 [Pseudomonas reidholzensis]